MHKKITLKTAENIAIKPLGGKTTFQKSRRFAVVGVQLNSLAGGALHGTATLLPLDADDKPIPGAAPVRKMLTPEDTAGVSKDFEKMMAKLFV